MKNENNTPTTVLWESPYLSKFRDIECPNISKFLTFFLNSFIIAVTVRLFSFI